KDQKPKDAADKGWAILETQLYRQRIAVSFAQASRVLTAVAEQLGFEDRNALLIAIGLDQKQPAAVVPLIAQQLEKETFYPEMQAAVSALDDANLPQRLARCCRPVPPDVIVGYVTKGNRITIHKVDCARVRSLRPIVHADWNNVNVQYRTEISLQCVDRPGLVRDVSLIVSDSGTNMTNFHADRLDGGAAYIQIGFGDIPRSQREQLVTKLRQVADVEQVTVRAPGFSHRSLQRSPLPGMGGNPYTLRPVTGESFFGRRVELRELINNLRMIQPGEAVLLWGPRRIGKTSLLLQFQQNIMSSEDYVLGFLDMQRLSGRSTTMFLRDIIRAVLKPIDSPAAKAPNLRNMRRDPLGYFRSFIELNPLIQNKHLVLILDEFQLLANLTEDYVSLADINRYFRSLIQHRGGLSIIFSGGGILDTLLEQPETSFMLEVARYQKVGCLSEGSARQLIVEPAQRVQFDEAVVERLVGLTAGHPYYLQWLCGELVAAADRQESNLVEMAHMSRLLETWLPQQGAQFFNHLWGSASGFDARQQEMGQKVLTAVSHQNAPFVSFETLSTTLAGLLSQDDLWLILQSLTKIDTLVIENDQYRFRVPLVSMWMRSNYRLEEKI
ncbi:MAG: AAA family ATPase, partial [Chloroflexi bacterium]|nr:AAA family ATPase [Chloroflexota bacterium]